MASVFETAVTHVSAEQALEALFQKHLQHFDQKRCQQYLEAFGLPARPAWTDETGKEWSLWERVKWFGLHHPQGLKGLSLFNQLLDEQPNTPWEKASPGVRQDRVEAWWVVNRYSQMSKGPTGEANAILFELLKASLTKQSEGMPSSGLGVDGDGRWLSLALQTLEKHLEDTDASAGWADVAVSCLRGSLLSSGYGTRWWHMGKVKGTLKQERFVGGPGWESEGQLPGEPSWVGNGQAVRPAALAEGDNWARLTARILNILAKALEKQDRFDVQSDLGIQQDILKAEQPQKWSSPDLVQALSAVIDAGLVSPDVGLPAHQQWDGRALDALAWLHKLDPELSSLPSSVCQRWANELVTCQLAWEESSEPHVRALANMPFAPRHRFPQVWEWAEAKLSAEIRPVRVARGPSP